MEGSSGATDIGNRLVDTGGEGKGGTNWESSIETYTLPCVKLDSQWKFTVWSRVTLCGNLESWDGVGGRREVQEEGDLCVSVADSCCYMVETNTKL